MKYARLLPFLTFLALCAHSVAGMAAEQYTLRVVYADNWKPLSYNDNGHVIGLLPDRLDQVLSNQDILKIEHIAVPWARAQEMVKNGKADAMITTATPARMEFTFKSKSNVFILPFVLATNVESSLDTDIKDVDDLTPASNKTFCDVLGNGWADVFYKDKPVNVYIAPTITECLRLLQYKRVDGIVHAHPVLDLYIRALNLEDKIRIHPTPSRLSPDFVLLVSRLTPNADKILDAFDAHFSQNYQTIHLTPQAD